MAIWNNIIVYTNFDEAAFGSKCPTNSVKIFYMWDLDWPRSGYTRAQMLKMIGNSDYLFLRSEDYIAPVKSFFGREPDGINEDFNLETFETIGR